MQRGSTNTTRTLLGIAPPFTTCHCLHARSHPLGSSHGERPQHHRQCHPLTTHHGSAPRVGTLPPRHDAARATFAPHRSGRASERNWNTCGRPLLWQRYILPPAPAPPPPLTHTVEDNDPNTIATYSDYLATNACGAKLQGVAPQCPHCNARLPLNPTPAPPPPTDVMATPAPQALDMATDALQRAYTATRRPIAVQHPTHHA